MAKIDMIPNYGLVAEPTCEKELGDSIKIGRRGSINGIIIINGKQGHAAYPELAINPINLIVDRLPKLAGKRLDNGDEFFSPSQIVITDIRGGMEVTNVSPNNLKIMFNVRNSTKTTKQDLENYINEVLDGLDFELTLSQSAKPFMTNKNSKVIKKISQSIKNVLGIKTTLVTTGGTSDARFMPEYNIQSVEFGVPNDTIHACNEYVYEKDIIKLEECFSDFIENFNKE
jgi:succinyl-diaminopimelate desuccinylase